MGSLRWEWTLANGGTITADVDTDRQIETVLQGTRVLAEAPRGSALDGHTVLVEPRRAPDQSDRPPLEVVVTFDPTLPICILRLDGHDVAPSVWPVRKRPAPPPPARDWGKPIMLGLFVATLIVTGILLASRRSDAPSSKKIAGHLPGTFRAMNGLFIAHFPEELEAKLAMLPNGVAGVLLEDKEKSVSIVIAASPPDPNVLQEPWAIQQRLRDEALANVPKGIARFVEGGRRDDTCVGEHGALVTGNLMHKTSHRGRVWSCAFVREGAAYLALYSVAEPAAAGAEQSARAIIEATELTHLADIGTIPDLPVSADPR